MPRLTVIKSKTILISTLYFDSFFFSLSLGYLWNIYEYRRRPFKAVPTNRFDMFFFSSLLSFPLIFHKQYNESSIVLRSPGSLRFPGIFCITRMPTCSSERLLRVPSTDPFREIFPLRCKYPFLKNAYLKFFPIHVRLILRSKINAKS